MSDIGTMRDHIEDLMSEVSDLRAERDRWRETARLMYEHYHSDNGSELVAVYEASRTGSHDRNRLIICTVTGTVLSYDDCVVVNHSSLSAEECETLDYWGSDTDIIEIAKRHGQRF